MSTKTEIVRTLHPNSTGKPLHVKELRDWVAELPDDATVTLVAASIFGPLSHLRSVEVVDKRAEKPRAALAALASDIAADTPPDEVPESTRPALMPPIHDPEQLNQPQRFDADTILRHLDTTIVPRLRDAIRDAANQHGVRRRSTSFDQGATSVDFDLPELQALNDRDDRTPVGASWLNLAFEELAEAQASTTDADIVTEALQTMQVLASMITDLETTGGAR